MVCGRSNSSNSFTAKIDWSHDETLQNWMTELDLTCEEPYLIGLIGGISFVSFAVGSLMFTGIIDKTGRRLLLLYATTFTVLGILLLTFFANGLTFIYIIIFSMGLVYNCRASGAYIFCTEYIPKEDHYLVLRSIFIL